jgi:predicted metal-dependent phosphoesterase TrpH
MRWISPYYEDGTWLRGNFHTHTTVSDGGHTLEDTADHYFRFCRYKSSPWMQYRFLAITDHTTSGKKEMYRPIEGTDPDNGRCILIEGREDSYGHHILGIGCRMTFQEDIIQKDSEDYTLEDYQRVIDEIVKDGGIAILAHPHWRFSDYFSGEMAQKLENYTAIEIINGDLFTGPGHLATDVWDAALTAGKRVWATGNDDFHSVRDFQAVAALRQPDLLFRQCAAQAQQHQRQHRQSAHQPFHKVSAPFLSFL